MVQVAVRDRTDAAATPVRKAPVARGQDVVPGYQVLAHLRRGRDYDVYDVWSEERACRCIVKTLRPDHVGDQKSREHLVQEGGLLERLTHVHIVRAYESVLEPVPALVLETLTGETLESLIERRRSRLPWADIAMLGLHLCSAVQYLHRQGILHLDLKPSNIVCQHGLAKVIDLSLARPPGPGHKGAGTPQYMAPEQIHGADATAATDIWGIGVVLFEAATTEMPLGDTRDRDPERRAVPIASLRRGPTAITSAIDRCLNLNPSLRPTVEELATILEGLVGSLKLTT